MINTNATNFIKNIFEILEQTIKFNELVNISTKNGNAIIISEDDCNGLIETLYLSSNPIMKQKIMDGMNISLDDCVSEDEVK